MLATLVLMAELPHYQYRPGPWWANDYCAPLFAVALFAVLRWVWRGCP